ncbi:MAG: hypothetical protein R3E12_14485 [Candidatus Eisenbacteria bacterium]
MNDWRWGLGAVVLGVVLVAAYVQILTARHRSYVDSKRMRERRKFRPDWGRHRTPDPTKRRGIHIRR